MKPVFLLDIDGVVADFLGAVRRCVAEVSSQPVTVTQWDFPTELQQLRPVEYRHYRKRSAERGFCGAIPLLPGAAKFVEQLRSRYRVVALTTPLDHCETWESERRAWLRGHLNFEKRDVVFAHDKSLIPGGVFLDDRPENVRAWAAAHPSGRGLLMAAEYNAGRGYTYAEVLRNVCL
jgi:5'(3')-deoxyribonucleotidase